MASKRKGKNESADREKQINAVFPLAESTMELLSEKTIRDGWGTHEKNVGHHYDQNG